MCEDPQTILLLWCEGMGRAAWSDPGTCREGTWHWIAGLKYCLKATEETLCVGAGNGNWVSFFRSCAWELLQRIESSARWVSYLEQSGDIEGSYSVCFRTLPAQYCGWPHKTGPQSLLTQLCILVLCCDPG